MDCWPRLRVNTVHLLHIATLALLFTINVNCETSSVGNGEKVIASEAKHVDYIAGELARYDANPDINQLNDRSVNEQERQNQNHEEADDNNNTNDGGKNGHQLPVVGTQRAVFGEGHRKDKVPGYLGFALGQHLAGEFNIGYIGSVVMRVNKDYILGNKDDLKENFERKVSFRGAQRRHDWFRVPGLATFEVADLDKGMLNSSKTNDCEFIRGVNPFSSIGYCKLENVDDPNSFNKPPTEHPTFERDATKKYLRETDSCFLYSWTKDDVNSSKYSYAEIPVIIRHCNHQISKNICYGELTHDFAIMNPSFDSGAPVMCGPERKVTYILLNMGYHAVRRGETFQNTLFEHVTSIPDQIFKLFAPETRDGVQASGGFRGRKEVGRKQAGRARRRPTASRGGRGKWRRQSVRRLEQDTDSKSKGKRQI